MGILILAKGPTGPVQGTTTFSVVFPGKRNPRYATSVAAGLASARMSEPLLVPMATMTPVCLQTGHAQAAIISNAASKAKERKHPSPFAAKCLEDTEHAKIRKTAVLKVTLIQERGRFGHVQETRMCSVVSLDSLGHLSPLQKINRMANARLRRELGNVLKPSTVSIRIPNHSSLLTCDLKASV